MLLMPKMDQVGNLRWMCIDVGECEDPDHHDIHGSRCGRGHFSPLTSR